MSIKDWFLDIEEGRKHQRSHIRVKAINLIRIENDDQASGRMVLNASDLSECGVGFRTSAHLPEGHVYSVALHTPQRDISATARIRWSRWVGGPEKAYEVGAELESLKPDDKVYLRGIIQTSVKKNK